MFTFSSFINIIYIDCIKFNYGDWLKGLFIFGRISLGKRSISGLARQAKKTRMLSKPESNNPNLKKTFKFLENSLKLILHYKFLPKFK